MKTLLKVLKWAAVGVVVLVVGFVLFVYARAGRTFDAPYPEITASQDSSLIARGAYLVNGPAHCADCHTPMSEADRVEAGEIVPLSGGYDFVLPVGIIHAPNITPDVDTGIGKLSDGEIARSLRHGVRHDGRALVDFMPFYDADDRDLTAIISYLRTTSPVRNPRPEHEWNFLGNMVRALGMIKPMGDGDAPRAPSTDTTAAYGGYLARNIANCRGCHTDRNLMTGAFVGPDFAGQMAMEIDASSYLVTPNLTPDPATGRIANWTEDMFVQRFRRGKLIEGSMMPWGPFSRMSDLELKALFRYFSSLEPIVAERPIPVGPQQGKPPA